MKRPHVEFVGDLDCAEYDLLVDDRVVSTKKGGEMARASRIEEQQLTLAVCPVCKVPIVGVLTVALQMGPMKVTVKETPAGSIEPSAKVDVKASLRSLTVAHKCAAGTPEVDAPPEV